MIMRLLAIVPVVVLLLWSGTAAAERTVVLVTNRGCPISDLSSLQIRKAYLGVSVQVDNSTVRPLRLTSDAELNEIFFQAIVAMSEKSYHRRALSLAVKFGTPRPGEFSSLSGALEALEKSTCGIIFLWTEFAAMHDNGKMVKVLWCGE